MNGLNEQLNTLKDLQRRQTVIDAKLAVYGDLANWILTQPTPLETLRDYILEQIQLMTMENATIKAEVITLQQERAEAHHGS